VVAHNRIGERGKAFEPSARVVPLAEFSGTHADEVIREDRALIEFNTPIEFAGKLVGTATLALTTESLVAANRSVRRYIMAVASIILGLAFLGALLASSFLTTRVKRLHEGVLSLGGGEPFRPIPESGSDELGDLTRKFNRMAEELLSQKHDLERWPPLEGVPRQGPVIGASQTRGTRTTWPSTRVAKLSSSWESATAGREARVDLERAAIFHDLGKIQTPDDVLLKKEPLSDTEEERMRNHPSDGTEILQAAPFLRRYIPVVRAHHEWFNGEGYPDGKKGHEIPFHAQSSPSRPFDPMTTDRPYRQALTPRSVERSSVSAERSSRRLADAFARWSGSFPRGQATYRSMRF
jgi:putative nucleotidyltransferase with HDIG domain